MSNRDSCFKLVSPQHPITIDKVCDISVIGQVSKQSDWRLKRDV